MGIGIGDWVRYGEAKWCEKYAQALDATELEYQTLANDKWVADKVDFSRRRENLSFDHHKEVASLEPEEQDTLLQKAEEEQRIFRLLTSIEPSIQNFKLTD